MNYPVWTTDVFKLKPSDLRTYSSAAAAGLTSDYIRTSHSIWITMQNIYIDPTTKYPFAYQLMEDVESIFSRRSDDGKFESITLTT